MYSLNVYMKDELRFKCLSVGMSGQKTITIEQEPIQGNHLYAMPPGKATIYKATIVACFVLTWFVFNPIMNV